MRILPVIAASAASVFLLAPSYAQDPHGHDKATDGAPALQQRNAASDVQFGEHMRRMQAIHDRMMAATTPEERQRAMEEGRKAMEDGMSAMQQMMGPGDTMGRRSPGGDQGSRMQRMERRLDVMQMTMQMMLDQQSMGPQGMGRNGPPR